MNKILSVVWLLASLGESASISAWDVMPGRYCDDRRLTRLRATCVEGREAALGHLAGDWGLVLGRLPVLWQLETSDAVQSTPQANGTTPVPFELGRTSFGHNRVTVILPARKFLQRPSTVKAVVLHETVHAVFASQLGRRRYQALPQWFHEGIALLISGEGKAAWRQEIAYAVFQERPADSFLASLRSSSPSPAAAYCVVHWLHRRVGQKRLARLLRSIAAGQDFDTVLRRTAGFGTDQVRDLSVTAARRAVRETLSVQQQARFHELHRRLRGRDPSAAAALESFVLESTHGVLAETAHYLLAKAAFRGERHDDAISHLRGALSVRGPLWRPEVLLLLARSQAATGQVEAARRSLQEAQEVFGEDRDVAAEARVLAASWAH